MSGENSAEASLDWKPNGHTAPGPGIEPGLSGPQRGGSNTTLPASPIITDLRHLQTLICYLY